jgi:threonyl-tRNA synthetase
VAPLQIQLIPISDKFEDYVQEVLAELLKAGLRASVDARNEKLDYKIRSAELLHIPYMGVIGEREVLARTLAVRKRKKKNLGAIPVAEVITRLLDEVSRRALPETN